MSKERFSGVLLHPTSLPGPFGIGDMGPSASLFVDFLVDTGQTYWQIPPLTPIGYGNSPYSSNSAFAGNILLISPERLAEEGLLEKAELPSFPAHTIDYENVSKYKDYVLRQSFHRFHQHKDGFGRIREDFDAFMSENKGWLPDYGFFSALKKYYHGTLWTSWDPKLVNRNSAAVKSWTEKLAEEIDYQCYVQFLFFRQWSRLRDLCRNRGVKIIGDIPIYVSQDSADVWLNQYMFKLDAHGNPTVVAGVPPDYFSETGQRWGNPIYRWKEMDGFPWWIARIQQMLKLVDVIRLDHFLAFNSYYEIPAEESNAVKGKWVPGPGKHFFDTVKKKLGDLPFLAENLGAITPEAEALRKRYDMPGMAILHFSFPPDYDPSHPYNFEENTFVYTGTHDNDTTVGWFQSHQVKKEEKEFALKYLNSDGKEIHWDFVRLCLSLHAKAAVVPLQDLLGKGTEARMNYPGRGEGNWLWRFRWEELTPEVKERFGSMTEIYGRSAKKKKMKDDNNG